MARLLVIEGDEGQRSGLVRLLEAEGYEVHVSKNGLEGVESTRKVAPQLVLCDGAVAESDGLDFCRRVKAEAELRETYVIVVGASREVADVVTALDAGADDYLTKPFEIAELLARVRAGLRLREHQREQVEGRHRAALLNMAATLGHEVNNPLTALFGHLELALQYMDRGDPAQMRSHLETAGEVATRIGCVAHRLMVLAEPRLKSYLGGRDMLDLDDEEEPLAPAQIRTRRGA